MRKGDRGCSREIKVVASLLVSEPKEGRQENAKIKES